MHSYSLALYIGRGLPRCTFRSGKLSKILCMIWPQQWLIRHVHSYRVHGWPIHSLLIRLLHSVHLQDRRCVCYNHVAAGSISRIYTVDLHSVIVYNTGRRCRVCCAHIIQLSPLRISCAVRPLPEDHSSIISARYQQSPLRCLMKGPARRAASQDCQYQRLCLCLEQDCLHDTALG